MTTRQKIETPVIDALIMAMAGGDYGRISAAVDAARRLERSYRELLRDAEEQTRLLDARPGAAPLC